MIFRATDVVKAVLLTKATILRIPELAAAYAAVESQRALMSGQQESTAQPQLFNLAWALISTMNLTISLRSFDDSQRDYLWNLCKGNARHHPPELPGRYLLAVREGYTAACMKLGITGTPGQSTQWFRSIKRRFMQLSVEV